MFKPLSSAAETFLPIGYRRRSRRARTTRPPRLVVLLIRLITVSYERSGLPRQLIEMNEKRRCSTLFPLARARREMAHVDDQTELVSNALKLVLPGHAIGSYCCRRRQR